MTPGQYDISEARIELPGSKPDQYLVLPVTILETLTAVTLDTWLLKWKRSHTAGAEVLSWYKKPASGVGHSKFVAYVQDRDLRVICRRRSAHAATEVFWR